MNASRSENVSREFMALTDFARAINSDLDLDFTLNNLLLTAMGKLLVGKGAVYLRNDNDEFELKLTKGLGIPGVIPEKISIDELNEERKVNSFFDKREFPVTKAVMGPRGRVALLLLGKKMTKTEYSPKDIEFVDTLANLSGTAIENARAYSELKKLNKELDSKVNQLSVLFELGKEFGQTLEVERAVKLLVFSLIGQLAVSRFAVLFCKKGSTKILESKFDKKIIEETFSECDVPNLKDALEESEIGNIFPKLSECGVRLIIPMRHKDKTEGLILLGERKNNVSYAKSDIDFASSLASIAVISIENATMVRELIEKQKLEKELETARAIQRSLLPRCIPELKNFEISAVSESARQVGGDYYDLIELNENETLIAIADVSGKGVQAALLMANLQAFLKSVSKQNLPLEEATALINDLVSDNTRMGNFITFFWGVLNDSTGEFRYVNAGHNPPLLVDGNEIHTLKKGGMLLGVTKTLVPYEAESVVLKPSSKLILFTDGITEAMNEDFQEYGEERLRKLVSNFEGDAREILSAILEDVNRHRGKAEQSDDITCVIISGKGQK